MPVKTVPIHDLVAVLRRPFELRVDAAGVPIPDSKSGEVQHVTEAVVPGLLTSTYELKDVPGAVRLKVLGGSCPSFPIGARVRLSDAQVSAWYQPRGQGVAKATSAATVRAGRVQATTNPPVMRGGLPAHLAGAGAMLLGVTGDRADVLVDPVGVFAVESLVELRMTTPASPDLIGERIELLGLRVYFTVPDRTDVSRTAKSSLILAASAIERAGVPVANGKARKADETPAEVTA